MKVIEIHSKTNAEGYLKLNYQLNKFDASVKVLILLEDDLEEDEKLWLSAISKNKVFNFLNEPEEDVYSLTDGEKFND